MVAHQASRSAGRTAVVGLGLITTTNADISAVDVSGAKASTTYTLTSAAGGIVTLSDGAGNSQAVTLSAIGATGTEAINFSTLGVKITVVGAAAKTAVQLIFPLVLFIFPGIFVVLVNVSIAWLVGKAQETPVARRRVSRHARRNPRRRRARPAAVHRNASKHPCRSSA